MDRCECSLVNTHLASPGMEEQHLLEMFCQMLLGLEHCHEMRVVHRDVKPSNFLLSRIGDVPQVKLCDFKLAQTKVPGRLMFGTVGTSPFMPPEMFMGNSYNESTDIWSFGVSAFMMLFGQPSTSVKSERAMNAKLQCAIASA